METYIDCTTGHLLISIGNGYLQDTMNTHILLKVDEHLAIDQNTGEAHPIFANG